MIGHLSHLHNEAEDVGILRERSVADCEDRKGRGRGVYDRRGR